MKIGIDLDGTITYAPEFFKLFTTCLAANAEVHVITCREIGTEAEIEQELKELGIGYNKIAIVCDKVSYVKEHGIKVYFDDTDEFFLHMPKDVTVFKIREEHNFHWRHRKWLYSDDTGVDLEDIRLGFR